MADTKNTAAEVGIRLVVDSNARKATEDLKKDLEGAEGHAKKKASKIGEVFSLGGNAKVLGGLLMGGVAAAGAAAAAGLGLATGAVYKSIDAFMEGSKEAKSIAGALTLIDQKGNDFQTLREYANDVKDELDGIAMAAGASKESVVAMFNDIAERGGKSVEGAKELTQQMVMAGRALPGGGEALAEGFSMIEMGVVRAKNPIVQVIAATHTLKGSAKAVAKQMQAMTIDKQMEIAEKAIAKMAGKMKDVPLTLGEMKTSIGETLDKVFEETGRPIVQAMSPIFARVQHELMSNSSKLAAFGEMFGTNVGKGLDFALDVMEALFDAFKNNWKDIQGAFDELKDTIEPVFKYIYENRKVFAQTFADVATQLIKAFTWIWKTMASVYAGIGNILKAIGKQIPGVGDFIRDEERTAAVKKVGETINTKGTAGAQADFEAQRKSYVDMAIEQGRNAAEAQQEFSQIWSDAVARHTETMKAVEGARQASVEDDAAKFAAAFNVARTAHDKSAEEYVVKFLEGNMSMANALSKAGPEIFKGGFEDFMSVLKDLKLDDVAGAFKKKPDLGVGGKANVLQNFNGPINIKQDFRDQDPDDIAVVFKEELSKAGTNRLQSTFASAGGF